MKTKEEIVKVLIALEATDGVTNYPNTSYENGIDEALSWVLEELSDEEFSYAPD